MPFTTGDNNYSVAKWQVDPVTGQGTHTTIQAAITAASSGDTVFIRANTSAYTENLTLKAGVNLTAFGSDSSLNGTGKVIISGTCTLTTAGSVTISGIQLQTNAAALLAVTGTLASIVNLENCYLSCGTSAITFSSSSASAQVNLNRCEGDITTTGVALFTHSSAGGLGIYHCEFTNTGLSTTASTVSAGNLAIRKSTILNPITTSGTGALFSETCSFSTSAQNVIAITMGGSGGNQCDRCGIDAGSASAVTISAANGELYNCTITSSNTNAIAGAGTLNYIGLLFKGTSSNISTTTQVANIFRPGITRSAHQPAFFAYQPSNATNAIGGGAAYTLGTTVDLTEVFDQNNNFVPTTGVFTAPYTGLYFFHSSIRCAAVGATMTLGNVAIVTTQRTFTSNEFNAGLIRSISTVPDLVTMQISIICPMTVGDTATATVNLFGATAVATVVGDANGTTYFGGYMIC